MALYTSLSEHCHAPFELWVLCLDDKVESALSGSLPENVRLLSLSTLTSAYPQLATLRGQREDHEFYWTCKPFLVRYAFAQTQDASSVCWIDADQYIFHSMDPLFKELASASILITDHRFTEEQWQRNRQNGRYNAGLMFWNRDEHALACLEQWGDECVEWCFGRYEDGRFGDQKYIENWEKNFDGVRVLRHPGAGAGPWNLEQMPVAIRNGILTVDDQPLIMFHFHHFHWLDEKTVIPVHAGPYEFKGYGQIRAALMYANALTRGYQRWPQASVPDRSNSWKQRLHVGPPFLAYARWSLGQLLRALKERRGRRRGSE